MKDYSKSRYPNLSKLSIALLEHAVEPIIGENARDILKAPLIERELQDKLCDVMTITERRFGQEHSDKELTRAILDLPLANLSSLQSAVREFYERPTDKALFDCIISQLSIDYPSLAKERVEAAAITYLKILREELIPISSAIREKLSSLALFGIQESTEKINDTVTQIFEIIRSVGIQRSHIKTDLGVPKPDYQRPILYSSPSFPLIIDAAAILDSSIADIEKKLGQPFSVDAMGIGELEEIPDGGQSRIYVTEKHTFYVNCDKKGIATGLQVVRGLLEQKYSLDDWPIIFARMGVTVTKYPDIVSKAARRWINYLGYGMWITTDKVDGFVWTIKIHRVPK
jgi:hypothetical protein